MNKITLKAIALIILLCSFHNGYGARYNAQFHSTPVARALVEFAKSYPELKLSFLYNELDHYKTSATVSADEPVKALRQLVGMNPIMVSQKQGRLFVEALQKGKFTFHGRVLNELGEAVPYATVLLLAPKDSTVVTYGISAADGSFTIPCDRKSVLAKISSTGHRTEIHRVDNPDMGNVRIATRPVMLDNVKVEAQTAKLYSDRTVYLPQQRQKDASMSGVELLERMGIPQLVVNPQTGSAETAARQRVALFIDFHPASSDDLRTMNIQDVKRVEYLDFPSDPRFLGNNHVVNFIMAKYEYGGYVRANAYENFVFNSGGGFLASRFQYKKMTYDLRALGFYFNNNKARSEDNEMFRLPEPDGTAKVINRYSATNSSKRERQQYSLTFKAAYSSDHFTANNTLSGAIDNQPHTDSKGSVSYSPEDYPDSHYTNSLSNKAKTLSYFGNFSLFLPGSNTFVFTPQYSYSQTTQHSAYAEAGQPDYLNGASDRTNSFSARLSYMKNLGKAGSFNAAANGSHDYYRTRYNGTANALDRSKNTQASAEVEYSIEAGPFYGYASLGWFWNRSSINDFHTIESSPTAAISLQYLFRQKHQVSATFRYDTWSPNASFKSENVVKQNHLMSYTGNRNLVPTKNFSVNLVYTWIPSNRFYLSASGYLWSVNHRYVYDYEASQQGLLRVIRQPMGRYYIGNFSLSATAKFLGNRLQLSGGVIQDFAHNGNPYNFTKYPWRYYLNGYYYLGNFYFSASYSSRQAYSDGFMVGTWMDCKDSYIVGVGWSSSRLNVRMSATNFARWNKYSLTASMHSPNYSTVRRQLDADQNAFFSLSVVYTFSYGKKVSDSGEPGRAASANSGILKN